MEQHGQIVAGPRVGTNLVSSADVNGALVFSPEGEQLGRIGHLMIDRITGRIVYAVMNFGGFLGLGANEHPIPWQKLRYDEAAAGYVTDITRSQLENAPPPPQDWMRNRDYESLAFRHYGIAPYWL
ncbi:MAG: PRC-barrel domain-containing protein [Rhodobacteraceae bacterium]|jgi:hypothetical protein|nr:PRC-barrel domain-containing protein [Paracoccaceae bacterium]